MDIKSYKQGVKKALSEFKNEDKPDYIIHVTDYEEVKPEESKSEKKRRIALSTMPMFDTGLQSRNGLVTAYCWGKSEVMQLLDGLFVRGVTVLMNENLERGEEEHALLALFASELFDKFCENGKQDSDYLRWGLAKKLAGKPLNIANAKLLNAFRKLNP